MKPGMRTIRIREHGICLVEVIIALSLTAFGLLAVAQIFVTAANTSRLARSKEHAVLTARNKLEYLCDLYQRDASHPDLHSGNHGPEEIPVWNPYNTKIMDLFRLTWSVQNISDPGTGRIPSGIEITVSAIPIRNDGSPVVRPYFSGTVMLTAIVGPQIL